MRSIKINLETKRTYLVIPCDYCLSSAKRVCSKCGGKGYEEKELTKEEYESLCREAGIVTAKVKKELLSDITVLRSALNHVKHVDVNIGSLPQMRHCKSMADEVVSKLEGDQGDS